MCRGNGSREVADWCGRSWQVAGGARDPKKSQVTGGAGGPEVSSGAASVEEGEGDFAGSVR
jgi:hypothetical protein